MFDASTYYDPPRPPEENSPPEGTVTRPLPHPVRVEAGTLPNGRPWIRVHYRDGSRVETAEDGGITHTAARPTMLERLGLKKRDIRASIANGVERGTSFLELDREPDVGGFRR